MSDPAWVPEGLEQPNFHCTIHDKNAADCPCATIEHWDREGVDPYRERPRTGRQYRVLAMFDWEKLARSR